ncbi:GntR family transcriptional regulator [Erythrobacter sp. SCSIO 43205]|uniref:GntR family transcriptional regulator n=1 Tax=Erythrobacter sp. SCSIO 43205 TaxID=2779361 RepID=UPI001CA7F0E6|nr:GntR family transcriptional regulator [Erythrobacter sp. SCSIO 43205]UAB77651.1 GntR family transcriptional regulator [Erythrobacter sp. SCSIO 43205]
MTKASDRAYQTIRSMILSGELSSGDALREEALAERCGVSRTPIREALRQLEADLLVRRTESQRSYVADWSLDDVEDAFELRAMLEGHAARRAAERMTDQVVKELKFCNKAILAAVSRPTPDVATFLDRNRDFHALVLATAGSPRLTGLLTSLIEQPVVWRTAQHYDPEAFKSSHREHADLLAAFERRDGAWAESIMAGHIRRAFHAYCDAHKGLKTAHDQPKRGAA